MGNASFIFTICFVLIGPVKIIHPFAELTAGTDSKFRRSVAIRSALVAAGMCLFVAVAGELLVAKYHVSLEALRLGGGLVLLLSALNAIFPKTKPKTEAAGQRTPHQLAISPMATPIIVSPAGIAAILIFVMVAPDYPGMYQVLAIVLAGILALDFLVMFFNATIVRVPGLMSTFGVVGAVLVFMQVALSIQVMLNALKDLKVVE